MLLYRHSALQCPFPQPIPKTPQVLQVLTRRLSKASGGISPTAISNYLRCQLRFFYRYVSNLQEPDENDDELIDNRLFGNIFHRSAELVYLRFGHQRITSADLDALLKSTVEIEQAVDRAIKEELFQIKEPVLDIASVSETYLQLLKQKTGEIFNSDLAFTPTDDNTRCRTCPYAALCGR